LKSALSNDSKLSDTHQLISFFDDPDDKIKASEYLGHEPESYMLVGFPGSGKTTLAMTFPGAYLLNFDRKSGSVPEGTKIRTFEHGQNVYAQTVSILDAMSNLEMRIKFGIKTVIIDTLTAMSELMEVHCVADPELNPKGTKGLLIQHYGIIQHQIVEIIRRCYEVGLDVVVTAHADEIQDDNGELVYHPAITGKKGGPKLGGKFDNVIWMERGDNGFISSLKGTNRFPHSKLAVSPFVYKEMPDRLTDLTYKKLVAIKAGKAKVVVPKKK
jgi:hypothetical protein